MRTIGKTGLNRPPTGRRVLAALAGLLLCLGPAGTGAESATNRATGSHPGRGFSYEHDQIAEGPWSVHVVKVDVSNPRLGLQTTLATGTFGLTTLSEQVKSLPPGLGTPVAAINGDYYTTHKPYIGDPKGLHILQGELVSAPSDWTCLWIDAAGHPRMSNVVSNFRVTWPDGSQTPFGLNEERADGSAVLYTPRIGASTHASGGVELILERQGTEPWLPLQPGRNYPARVQAVRETGDTALPANSMILSIGPQLVPRVPKLQAGGVVTISTMTVPDLTGVNTAIGGGPALVRGAKVLKASGAEVRHPRTAVGWNKANLFLVEVDGRQPSVSVGMTLAELSNYMVKLGCDEALNLDGGGSSTLWVYGHVMNSPSEGRERGMANALILIQKEKSK
jgi:hypothetical protein